MKKMVYLLLIILMLTSCRNKIRQELDDGPRNFTHLRDFGSKLNQGILDDAQKIETNASIAELKRSLEQQSTDLSRIIDRTRILGRTHYFLGLKYREAGMFSNAVASFKQAIELDALNARLFYEAGISAAQVALTLTDRKAAEAARAEALLFLEKSVAMNNSDSEAVFALATLYSHFYDRFKEADQLMRHYQERWSASVESLFLQGFIAAGLGENQRAAGYFDQIAKLPNVSADIRTKANHNRDQVLLRIF